jgi:hypothetical protein
MSAVTPEEWLMNVEMTRMMRGSLCVVGAVMAVACSDGGRTPTAPTASASAALAPAGAPGAGGTLTAGAAGTEQARPFGGTVSLVLTEEPLFQFPIVSVHYNLTGEATHLGRFTGTLQVDIDISHAEEGTETSSGTIVLTAANGDQVTGSVTGSGTVDGENRHIVETVVVTGGTGRFADATGTFAITRDVTGFVVLPGAIGGTISY